MTDSLRESDIDKATEHKRTLEERQRTEERHRTETGTPWKTKYFIKEVHVLHVFRLKLIIYLVRTLA